MRWPAPTENLSVIHLSIQEKLSKPIPNSQADIEGLCLRAQDPNCTCDSVYGQGIHPLQALPPHWNITEVTLMSLHSNSSLASCSVPYICF